MGAGGSVQQIPDRPLSVVIPPTDDTNKPLPFPKHGVHLSFANQFIAECGGRDALEGLTTTEVNDQFVKPATFAAQSSYCDMLTSQHHEAVGIATVFISHAWKYHFLDVVDALDYHFKVEPHIIIWFDLFSNNQHKAVDLDFHWWCNTFKSAIQMFGRTVMVLSPWSNPIPLTRGWCLFELYCTAASDDCKFEVAMSQTHQTHFFDDMATDGAAAIDKMLATINAEKSECWKAEDRDRIFDAVRKTVGFPGINAMVFEQLRQWVVVVTLRAISQEMDPMKLLGLKSTLGKLYVGQGKYDLAEPLCLECFLKYKEVLNDHHPSTLLSMNYLARLYYDQGKYDLALPLYIDCLTIKKEELGDRHPETLRTIKNLANLYDDQGKYELAEPLKVEILAMRKEVFGDRHVDTLHSMNNLADLYARQEKYELAEPLYVECLAMKKEVMGDRHPVTLVSMNSLAGLYYKQGKYELAERLYVDCLAICKEVLGDLHPSTLRSMNGLAILHESQGKYGLVES